jgi:hypothetical protein
LHRIVLEIGVSLVRRALVPKITSLFVYMYKILTFKTHVIFFNGLGRHIMSEICPSKMTKHPPNPPL